MSTSDKKGFWFTPTHMKMLALLRDGQAHTVGEIMECLDEMSDSTNLYFHLSSLRKRLAVKNHTILREIIGANVYTYRLVTYSQVTGPPDLISLGLCSDPSNGQSFPPERLNGVQKD